MLLQGHAAYNGHGPDTQRNNGLGDAEAGEPTAFLKLSLFHNAVTIEHCRYRGAKASLREICSRFVRRYLRSPRSYLRVTRVCAGIATAKRNGVMHTTTALREGPFAVERAVEINSANVKIYYLSRSWAFLLCTFLGLLALASLASYYLAANASAHRRSESLEELRTAVRAKRPDFQAVLGSLLALPQIPTRELDQDVLRSNLSAPEKAILVSAAGSLREGFHEPNAQLLILAHQAQPAPGANAVMAELASRRGEAELARHYLHREIEADPQTPVRAKIVAMHLQNRDFDTLVKLAADPNYAPYYTPLLRARIALVHRDWSGAFTSFIRHVYSSTPPQALVMAIAAGLAWLIIAVHAVQPHHWLSFRTIAPLVAALIGVAGGFVAQFLTIAQRELLDLAPTGSFLRDLAIYAGVIAPRDTLLKLLLAVPFLFFLVRRRSPLDTLVVCGCVGLGFAIPGNLELCKILNPEDSLARLLTANFFDFAAAALIGHVICRVIAREKGSLVSALTTIPAVTLTQGVYDAFTRIPGAYFLMGMATIAFLIVSRVFFIELRKWRDSFTDQCFLGATLVISLGALLATVLVVAAMENGFEAGSKALIRNLPTLLMVGVVFFGQFKRGFAPVGNDLVTPSHA